MVGYINILMPESTSVIRKYLLLEDKFELDLPKLNEIVRIRVDNKDLKGLLMKLY